MDKEADAPGAARRPYLLLLERKQLDQLIDKKGFSRRIENLIKNKPMPYMDAIIHCADHYGLEPETAAKLITKTIKEKLEFEIQDLNLLEKSATLPL